MKFLYCDYYF